MNIDSYPFTRKIERNVFEFGFESVGPRGVLSKRIRYTLKSSLMSTYFHLAFGDWHEEKEFLDDLVTSNNSDAKKIMGTVVETAIEVLRNYPNLSIYAKGSTPSRTRLCQIGIAQKIGEVKDFLSVFGFRNGDWELFQRSHNYSAFTLQLKENGIKK